MNHSPGLQRYPWTSVLAAAGIVAGARVVWIAALDGYGSSGLWNLAGSSASRHYLRVLPPAALGALVLVWPRLRTRPLGRLGLWLLGAALADLFICGRLLGPAVHAPGLDTPREQLAHGCALLVALASSALLFSGRPLARTLNRLAATAAVLALVAAIGVRLVRPRSAERADAPNFILISLDTVRADRLGCYGYPLPTTPELDRFFARSSVRFTRAFSPQPFTLTAHMSMFTGLVPQIHGVGEESVLPQAVPTLPHLLAQAGYVTFGIADSIVWMQGRYGFSRGFHSYRQVRGSALDRSEALGPLLADLDDERFFLFLHYYDAHSDRGVKCYESSPEDEELLAGWYRGGFGDFDEQGRWGTDRLWSMNQENRTLESAEDRRYLSSLYDAGLRTLDVSLGELFDLLDESGRLEDTVVIVVADHGEEFFEHGCALHDQLYQDTLHVPMLFRLPQGPPRSTSDEVVSLVDVAPTILDLAGVAAPPLMDGISLAGILRGTESSTQREGVPIGWEATGLITRDWSLLPPGMKESSWQLFDLSSDPGQRHDLLALDPPPAEAERLLELAAQDAIRFARERAGIGLAEPVVIDPEARQILRDLGYAGK